MAIEFNDLIKTHNKENYYYIMDLDAIRKATRKLKSHWEYFSLSWRLHTLIKATTYQW
ncbi:hypothetical protein [Serratia symbiotica]|uniref:hypothetical protein n=1 Tax=Serratia symbiotica TaxID=138074 RepID=UPI001FCF8117|nr:hypothetical protein [Serratia symbiotica]